MLKVIPTERIVNQIFVIRGKKVMFDRDLALLYQVETKNLNKAVSRNKARFPADFMFQLSPTEFENLKFHFGTSKRGGTRKLPYAFTEQGVAMLSSVLKSTRAVQVNIQIIRTFTQLREMLLNYRDLKDQMVAMEAKYDKNFRIVFEALNRFIHEEENPKPQIGFRH